MKDCGKFKFYTRADARRARRSTYGTRGKGRSGPLSIYRCEPCEAYHLGHMPAEVRNGQRDKDSYVAEVTRVRD